MDSFKAKIDIIGVNPFVLLPSRVLKAVFVQAGKDKGPIPVKGRIEGHPYIQTLVKYAGAWRLYLNGPMLKVSGKKVDERVSISIEFDTSNRTVPLHPELAKALKKDKIARTKFETLTPARQKEINRYLGFLKSEDAVKRNVVKAVKFLRGKSAFIGQPQVE